MERWTPLHDVPRRASILLAVEEHDNGWREPDAEPTIDPATGQIRDFITAPVEVRQSVWPRAVSRLATDPWAAALVAHHAVTVYDRFRGDAAWTAFFSELERLRDALVKQTGHAAAQLTHDYAFVRIGDLISLVFCNAWAEEQAFDGWTFRLSGERVVVAPDAFGRDEVPIAIDARKLPARTYDSDEELRRILHLSPVVTLHGVVAGA